MLQSVQMGIVPNVMMTEKSNTGQGLKVRKQEKYHHYQGTACIWFYTQLLFVALPFW